MLGCCLAVTVTAPARAELAFVVDVNNNFFLIDTTRATGLNSMIIGTVTGLTGSSSESIVGMDFRPSTGALYALSNELRLYLIDPPTARATFLHRFPSSELGAFVWGFDFDPRADRLRMVGRGPSLAKTNLLIDPDTFAVTAQTDIGGLAQFEEPFAIAYANNVANAASSTLYLFSDGSTHHRICRIGAVNDTTGASQAGGVATPLFEVGFSPLVNSVGLDVSATGDIYLAAKIGSANNLYRIDPSTGATQISTLTAPEMAEMRAFAVYSVRQRINVVTNDNKLVVIDSASPSQPAAGLPAAPVDFTGLQPGEQIMAIDVRPSTGELYGFSDQSRLYRIAPPTTAASTSAVATMVGSGPLPIAATSASWEMDFDPRFDRVRLARVQPGGIFHINPNDATIASVANLYTFDPVAVAYPMNVSPFTPSLVALDGTNGELITISSNNTVNAVADAEYLKLMGSHGLDVSLLDNTAFWAANQFASGVTTLFTMNLRTAELRSLGTIFTRATGPQTSVRSIAVASPGILRVLAHVTVGEAAGTATVFVDRVNGTNGPLSVGCLASDETATQPADFGQPALVRILANVSRGSCVVPIVDDTTIEATEKFTVTLGAPFGGGLNVGPINTVNITIIDNDAPVSNLLPAVTIIEPTEQPTYSTSGTPVAVAGTADDLDGTIASVQWTTDGGESGTATVTAAPSLAHVTWSASIPLHGGPNVITVTARDNSGASASDEITVTLPNTSRSYYLAEGATGGFFDYDLLLVNPNTSDVPITITFLRESGAPLTRSETLAARSRRTIRVDDLPGLESTAVSTIVTSTTGEPLVVERTMWWDATGYGAHTEKASEGQALTWYFAEGSQGFFQTYLLLANPQTFAITASVEYLREGATAITRTYAIGAQQRLTVDAGADPALVGQSFGMVVTFSHPAAAERAMYFGGPPLFRAGHESAGVTAPSTAWFLAEGATGPFFETFVLLANPNAEDASAEVTFLPSAHPPVTHTVTVPGRGRTTINVEAADPSLANEAVATRVTASRPIVVERAQYWPDPAPQWYEAHNSFGVTTLGTRWGLAEGRVGGPPAYQTYILLANPGLVDATVTITFLPETGSPFDKTFTVPASRRLNVSTGPGSDVPELTNVNFGAVVSATQPIAVERALYASTAGETWSAGTNATATRLPVTP